MDNVKLDQLNWTAIGFLTQTTLLVLALIDVDLVRFLIFRLGLLLVLVGAGFFFLVKNGRRSRLWLAGLLLKHQDKILGGTSKLFTLTPTKVAMVYFGILQRLVAKPKLWELQPIIPKLPVPPLSQTCATYLKTVKPLLSEEQFETTSRVVADFQTPGGIGQQLHGALVARYNDPNIDNWLEEMWETFAYLRIRDALPLSSNWYGVDRPHPTAHDKISRAANTAAAILSFKEMVDAEDLDPVLLYVIDFLSLSLFFPFLIFFKVTMLSHFAWNNIVGCSTLHVSQWSLLIASTTSPRLATWWLCTKARCSTSRLTMPMGPLFPATSWRPSSRTS